MILFSFLTFVFPPFPFLYSESSQVSKSDSIYTEQISCHPNDCISLKLEELLSEGVRSEIAGFMSENAGKILIDTSDSPRKIDSEDLEDIRTFLEEISKRNGKVVIEKLHIAIRSFQLPDPPFLKDVGLVGWNVFKRIYRKIYFRNTSDYHAKVLYHPETLNIFLVYFVHRKYGDICNTVFANCNEIEYLDDDTFDLQLSGALGNPGKRGSRLGLPFVKPKRFFRKRRLIWNISKMSIVPLEFTNGWLREKKEK